MRTDNSLLHDFSKVMGIMSNREVFLGAERMSFSTSASVTGVKEVMTDVGQWQLEWKQLVQSHTAWS